MKGTPVKFGGGGGTGGSGGSVTYFTVSFETNGGSKTDSISVEKNKTATEPAKPTKEGFIFDGWYSDRKLKTPYDFSEKVTNNITLYAKWTDEKNNADKPTTPGSIEWKNPFEDVTEDDWFYKDVEYVNKNDLMKGTSGTLFDPGSPITRGMFVTILWRYEGKPQSVYNTQFNDVPTDAYFA